MSVTNYNPGINGCKYTYNKLKNVVYLVSKSHIKDIHIDNGAAYIEDLSESPMILNGFNVRLTEESSLDERYAFTKSVTLSMHGYVSPAAFGERYYVILESKDGTYWMVNPDFPAKTTYAFNLGAQQNQTDFTFSLQSNFPTLQLITDAIDAVEPQCAHFNVPGIKGLKLLETGFAGLDTTSKTVYTYGKDFQDIEFLRDTCTLTETYDGDNVTTTIQFNIGFDAYKSSWHYNLLEFTENLYSAIITPKDNENNFFAGFNFGLQPGFNVQTSDTDGQSDIITITLAETSNHGSTAAEDYSESDNPDTKWLYVDKVGGILTYECVGTGIARYLVQQEINAKGYATGRYKVLEGYEDEFPNLNIIGTFPSTSTFSNPDCYDQESCTITTDIPNTITFTSTGCSIYSLVSTCNWRITNIPDYLTISPSIGSADTPYTVQICNTRLVTSDVYGSFNIESGNSTRVINVRLKGDSDIISPSSYSIDCLKQNVTFTFDPSCPIVVSSISTSLSYSIGNSTFVVTVPRNNTTSSRIWSITVEDCNGNRQVVTIYQDKTYERWNSVDGYICVDGNSYVKERRYTGATASNLVGTNEYRPGSLIQSDDTRCQNATTRFIFDNHYYCVDGNKFQALEQEASYDGGTTWMKTGVTQLGTLVESSSEWCNQDVTYEWRRSSKWQCGT